MAFSSAAFLLSPFYDESLIWDNTRIMDTQLFKRSTFACKSSGGWAGTPW